MNKKILIVDDDSELQAVFPLLFENRNFELKGVLNITDVEFVIEEFKPDLILLDIWIGDIDGRIVCNYLKSHEKTANIPIILISANLIDIDDANCRPDAIVQKPFEIGYLLEIMDELMI
ncbi:response regulator [Pedobacter aquatilis]|uniref:response regulator n=1 Tax=Pedobacter aquatilis TaxID=351343 RepID=UPI0025B3BB83|nr:response regulator [Pedobacter aquatilis]MDN3585076.1 response regulator [Pedobacter aquatilis]